tara:strand:- start:1309 stop:1674 length:366 start_codon:yes stop_codon:yes gene_type:complete
MIWEKIPDDILDIIYKKIIYSHPKNLRDDLVSYINTMDLIKSRDCIIFNYTDWEILWFLVLSFYKNDNKEKQEHYYSMQKYILKNNNLMIRFEGAMYWIKKYIKNISIQDRIDFIYSMNNP